MFSATSTVVLVDVGRSLLPPIANTAFTELINTPSVTAMRNVSVTLLAVVKAWVSASALFSA